MRRILLLTGLWVFGLLTYSQSVDVIEKNPIIVNTLIPKDSLIYKIFDSILMSSKDCLIFKENKLHYFHIFFQDSNNFTVDLIQFNSFSDYKNKMSLEQYLGYSYGGMIYNDNLFLLLTNFKINLFEEKSTILNTDIYFQKFYNDTKPIYSTSFFSDNDLDSKTFYYKVFNKDIKLIYSTPCIQNRNEIPLLKSQSIGYRLVESKSSSLFDVKIFSPYTDTLLIGNCTVLIEFDSIQSMNIKNFRILFLDISKILTNGSEFAGTEDILVMSKNQFIEYSLFEKEQIDYYCDQIPQLLNRLEFFVIDKDLIKTKIGKNQPVSIRFSIWPIN